MRKSLLIITLLTSFCFTWGVAQVCIPISLPLAGVYPNPLIDSNLPTGEQGTPYYTFFLVVVAGDTTIDLSPIIGFPGITVTADIIGQRINSIDSLPPGLSYACNPSTCEILADSAGCVAVSGIPTAAGTYQPVMDTEIGILIPPGTPVLGGDTIYLPIPGLTYDLEVTPSSVSIDDIEENTISLLEMGPNPFHTSTEVHFSAPEPGTISFEVRDLSGRAIYQNEFRTIAGTNSVSFDRHGIGSGIYIGTLSDGKRKATFKMTIID